MKSIISPIGDCMLRDQWARSFAHYTVWDCTLFMPTVWRYVFIYASLEIIYFSMWFWLVEYLSSYSSAQKSFDNQFFSQAFIQIKLQNWRDFGSPFLFSRFYYQIISNTPSRGSLISGVMYRP